MEMPKEDLERREPKIAVCLAAYNGKDYIAEQIETILNQQQVSVQIFISIDRSTDGTEDFLLNLAASEPRLTILPLGERFGGAGPNFYRLLSEVDVRLYDYVSLADQDDVWHPLKLSRACSALLENAASGYSSNFTAFWPSGRTQYVHKANPQRAFDFLFEAAGPGCTYVMSRDLACAIQGFIKNAGERLRLVEYHDWLFYAFARANGFVWIIDDWSSMRYRQHGHNQVGVNSGWRAFKYRVAKVLGGHGLEQARLIAELIQMSSVPIVRYGLNRGRSGYAWLAFHAYQCRRRGVDRVLFFIACILLSIKPG